MLVDASVALKWFLEEDDSEQARALISSYSLAAPEIVLPETANGLWKAYSRQIIDSETYRAALAILPGAFDRIHSTEPLVQQAGLLAAELDHPIYDCLYLVSTLMMDEELITADKRLLEKVAGTRFEGVCHSLSAMNL
jgi:predicted nucleic acid-binding protein